MCINSLKLNENAIKKFGMTEITSRAMIEIEGESSFACDSGIVL